MPWKLSEVKNLYPVEQSKPDTIRILMPQELKDDFVCIREGGLGVSMGATTAGDACGLGVATPRDVWRQKIFGDMIEELEMSHLSEKEREEVLKEQEEKSACMRHGNLFEPVTRAVYEHLSGRRVLQGCVWRFIDRELVSMLSSSSSSNKQEDPETSLERLHCSPDGCCLKQNHQTTTTTTASNGAGVIDYQRVVDARQKADTVDIRAMSQQALPMEAVEYGVEFKNPYFGIYKEPKKSHVCQTQYQAHVMNVPYIDYCATHISPRTELLEQVLWYRIYKTTEYAAGTMTHVRDYAYCLDTLTEPQWGAAHPDLTPPVRMYLWASGTPEDLSIPKDIVETALSAPCPNFW